MTKLLPFFTFYGGKNRAAKHYPEPAHSLIIEPFAGSAGYSLNYPDHGVFLVERDPIIAGTWEYLLREATPDAIVALPDLEPGQSTDDLDVPQGARWLIGWWLAKGTATPQRRPTTFMLKHPQGGPYWGPRIRDRIATQLEHVKHWQVWCGNYTDALNVPCTWFVDPPYQRAGRHYRHGAGGIDYAALATWVKERRGQVIACEADDADWLPFRPLVAMDSTEGRQKVNRARLEVVWP